jgi:hypothetical protein
MGSLVKDILILSLEKAQNCFASKNKKRLSNK